MNFDLMRFIRHDDSPPAGGGAWLPTDAGRNADDSEIPKPQKRLTDAERPVWLYVCKALKEQGLIHRTDVHGAARVIATTLYGGWMPSASAEQLQTKKVGTYIVRT